MLQFYEFDERIKKVLSTTEFPDATHSLAEFLEQEKDSEHLNV